MSKNAVPILIVATVVIVAVLGIFFLSNQKDINTSDINLNPTPLPTNAIISSPPKEQPLKEEDMNSYKTLPSGLKILDTFVGTGVEAKSGDNVTVNYIGTLTDGTKFDSSYDRNKPFSTQIGVGQVIKGWDEGIVGMKIGGKRKLIIPASLGYGSQDLGSIPPNSTLLFEVELLDVK